LYFLFIKDETRLDAPLFFSARQTKKAKQPYDPDCDANLATKKVLEKFGKRILCKHSKIENFPEWTPPLGKTQLLSGKSKGCHFPGNRKWNIN